MITPGIVAATQAAVGSAGDEFTPPIALDAYYDARSYDALADGAALSAWADLSGNVGHDLYAATGGSFVPPTLERDTFGTGAHSVRFGVNQSFRIPNFYHGWTSAECWIVLKVDSDPAGTGTGNGLWTFYPGVDTTNYPWTDGIIYDAFFRGFVGYVAVGNPSRSLAIINCVNISNAAGAGGYVYRLNGTPLQTASGGVSVAASGTDGWLGSYPTGVWLRGDIGMFALKTGSVSSGDRTAMLDWIKTQWPGLP